MSFSNLKKNMGTNGIKSLQDELEKMNKKTTPTQDERFWRLTSDKSGVGAAVIRFLPESEGESTPWVVTYKHSFKGPGGWYIENSLTTLNQPDPVSQYNGELWNSGIEANKNIARAQKRNTKYVSNILVIKDPVNPDNDGKVFLFEYGKKIFEKVKNVMFPEHDPVEQKDPMNPFCPWTGANFKLRVKRVGDYPSYEQSEFSSKEPLFGGDDSKIEAIWKMQHKLTSILDPGNFKSYDQLKSRLDKVLGLKVPMANDTKAQPAALNKPSLTESANVLSGKSSSFEDDDISDDLDYLQQLANEE